MRAERLAGLLVRWCPVVSGPAIRDASRSDALRSAMLVVSIGMLWWDMVVHGFGSDSVFAESLLLF